MSLTYSTLTTAEDSKTQLELLKQALELGNITEEQHKYIRRQIRQLERKQRKSQAREERKRNKKHQEEQKEFEAESLLDSGAELRGLRSRNPSIDLQSNMDGEDVLSQTSTIAPVTPKETFTCLCSTCGTGVCTSDYFCTAITHRTEEGQTVTTYGCVNGGSFMELAYCEGGKPGNSHLNTLSTVCCKGNMCNDVPPPNLHTTTPPPLSYDHSGNSNTESIDLGLLPTAIYLVVPAVLIVLLLSLIIFITYKTYKTAKRKRAERQRIKNYLGDNLSAQPLTEDCSIELPDPTSGSGSGMPMLVQRTVAKSVTLVDQIGSGKYGTVYRGLYQGSFVAVKMFLSKDIDSWSRENEIYTTLLLRHDNILGFLASDMISCDSVTQFWLICHYHENGSLFDFLNQPYIAITLSQCLTMLYSAAAGLVHLHTEITGTGTQAKPAIAHRDIKSKNILVKDDGSCCIADLGLAVTHKSKENVLDLGNSKKVGTKRYMAPEVLADTMNHEDFESYKRADIYAFSLVMWETLSCTIKDGHAGKYHMPYGSLVQNDPTFEEMRHVVVTQKQRPAIPPHWANHKVFRAMSKLIQECWCENPTARLTILRIKKTLGNLLEEAKDCKEYV